MVYLIGTINGVLTSVAIIVRPAGNAFMSGLDTNEYISAANGSPMIVKIASNPRTLKSLVRNSTK